MGPREFARAAQILTDSSAEERGETQRRRTLCDSLRLGVKSSPPASKAGYSIAETLRASFVPAQGNAPAILPSNFYGSCSAATRYGPETAPENSGPYYIGT